MKPRRGLDGVIDGVAEVQLWGRTIGAVALDEGRGVARFQHDPDFGSTHPSPDRGLEWGGVTGQTLLHGPQVDVGGRDPDMVPWTEGSVVARQPVPG